ncbi:MAG: ester cyclase [Acidobacteria bacterium]|nr:ester cyclase [Acidobacteriota bacterium]
MTITSRDGMRELLGVYTAAFPDVDFTVENQMSDGDQVVTRWTARATHSGEFDGVQPTGKSVMFTGITISRLENGRLVEEWENFDELSLMRQIGALPSAD